MQQSDFEQCQDFINKNLSFINNKEDCCKMGFAFQKLNPSCLILIQNLLAIDLAKCLPLNQQNVVGNFLLGVGQSMLVFSAQQTYMESGPGNCYNLKNLNSNNPDCTTDTNNTPNNSSSKTSSNASSNTSNNASSNASSNASNSNSNSTSPSKSQLKITSFSNSYQEQIDDIKDEIRFLKRWIDED